jgi:excisionase family DNA binding protein
MDMADTTLIPAQGFLTPEQAAEYLQVNRETIYRYIRGGKLIAVRLGRAYRIPRITLDALIWSHSTRPDISLRMYSDEQLEQFIAEDELTGTASETAAELDKAMETKLKRR